MLSLRHTWTISIIRTVVLGFVFVLGCLATVFTQMCGIYFFQNDPSQKQAVISLTKVHFVTLLTFVTSWINPCQISITYDSASIPESDSFKVDPNGNLLSILCPNSVFISNHQIYTDWLFIWFISYTARLADSIHIILKDLSKIPVLGYGMKNFNFMFLLRKWEADKVNLTNQLLTIDANARGLGPANNVTHVASTNVAQLLVQHWPKGNRPDQIWPYQIILFPEGTVNSAHTKLRSEKFCEKLGIPKLNHCLMPRVRGLFLTLRKLRDTVEVVYDLTTGYSDLLPTEFGEDKFTLKGFYLLGYGPAKINYHIRGFKIKDIPLGEDTVDIDDVKDEDLKKFEEWLFKIWYEKDLLLLNFYKYGTFIDVTSQSTNTEAKSKDRTVTADFKLKSNLEIIYPFATLIAAILILRLAWAATFFTLKQLSN
ncbi:hypothetical protein HYPBUDRAFT_103432 [Hyphopichia burtonii NRRL Y-1933]|uniref:Phospholipid/glycerol acyltransferase domain-containing protein n=1 Tax=Hyphopichia burtonii NRRL Y-1933 TaxID=984485 RepID=A0A1E4RQS2_9ASCO|nr:hypothetical protein HYPBUDRAFT_103432 [Hyphopichia burtonii NRRL Y-1933]ODV69607.1 hypothetical protein HYPBUDRAFT_103432 [Hyphopichia burtonii NRRL Y-1933]